MSQLSEHFSLDELTQTTTGLRNHPGDVELDNLRRTAHQMEAVRELLGHPIIVRSGYRSPAVNQAVRGVPTSAHCHGYAVDFICPGFGAVPEVAHRIVGSDIDFDQVICEGANEHGVGGWVHISFAPTMRREALTSRFIDGKAHYEKGIA